MRNYVPQKSIEWTIFSVVVAPTLLCFFVCLPLSQANFALSFGTRLSRVVFSLFLTQQQTQRKEEKKGEKRRERKRGRRN